MTEMQDLPAGRFSSWLRGTRIAQVADSGADVPCGECTACCTSSYFIHIGPEETQTLARISKELLFPAPGLSKGTVLMGYDENGHCPMLVDDTCSIYEHRPLTCRAYDCRVFSAAGIAADRALVTQRTRRWKFTYSTQDDRDQHAAVQAAAQFVQEHPDCFPAGVVPGNPAQVAILAINVCDVFVGDDAESRPPRRVTIENVHHPGSTSTVDAGMYYAMREAMLKVPSAEAPGLTQAQMQDAVLPQLPDDLFPDGAKAGWWSKSVQLDLEAKGVIARERSKPLRWHREPA